MQAAGMLRGTRAVYLLISLISIIGHAHPLPLQILPSIPGYIPVYIRHGDEPLEEINPALAEAFHEGPSLSKSIRLEDIPGPVDISLEEEEAFNGNSEKKNINSIHVRQVESGTSATKGTNKPTEKTPEAETPKLLTIYQLPDDNHRVVGRRHREKSRRKHISREPAVKVAPLTDEEKEALEKLTIRIDKEEDRANHLHNSDSHFSKLQPEVTYRNVHKLDPLLKVDQIIVDETNDQSSLRLTKDLSPLSADQETPASPVKDENPPVKVQRPAGFLSNVHKLSPIALPEEKKDEEPKLKEQVAESR